MEPFHSVVSRIRWKPEPLQEYVVGYADRFDHPYVELPLERFLESEIPPHRARYLKRLDKVVWDRRRQSAP